MRAALLCVTLVAVSQASVLSPGLRRALGAALLSASLPLASGAASYATAHPSRAELAEVLRDVREEAADYARIVGSSDSYARLDNSDDSIFYAEPRLVEHIDLGAVKALSSFHEREFEEVAQRTYGDKRRLLNILDLCASQSSHLPRSYSKDSGSVVVGVGMNALELNSNPALSAAPIVQDLNRSPRLALADASFDVVTLQLSIDYLTRPVDVLSEARRVLKKGSGEIVVSFSNRLFITKATAAWTSMSDLDRIALVCYYLEQAGFSEGGISVLDLSPPNLGGKGDPLYAVVARAI